METVPVFIGLDYHMASVQVCVVDGSGKQLVNRKCANDAAAVAAAIGPGREPSRVAVESCCGAADLAEELIVQAGWPVSLAHPGYVARMRHNPDKSDFSDARMLAELCRVGMVPPVWLAPAWIRDLRMLVRLRADLVGRKRAVKTRILGALRAQRAKEPASARGRWSRWWLSWLTGEAPLSADAKFVVRLHLEELAHLDAQIRTVESRLAELTADDPVVKCLRAVKGVGPVTAWAMRALIGRFDRFRNGKQLARFCAVTPRNASSGARMADSGLIRAGDPLLKTVLIEAAQRLRRFVPRWAELSRSMQERGKPVSVIVAAVANRWVRSMYHELKEVSAAA